MRAVVVAHGDPDPADRAQCLGADLVVAADGGALICERWGIVPHVVVGDMDSLGREGVERLRARGARIEAYPREKDETDLELAIEAARKAGADEIVLLAAFGGKRLDHEIANVLLLLAFAPRMSAVRGGTVMRVIREGERVSLAGEPGDLVSLVPLAGDAEGVRTDGLRYPLRDETLRFARARGMSNEIVERPAAVGVARGALLVVTTRKGAV
jgi:thiamine pyrophosphokinase